VRRTWLLVAGAISIVGCATIVSRFGVRPAAWPHPQRDASWHARHEAKVAEAKRRAGQVDLLFVGDSITQNYERAESPGYLNFRPIWDEFFAPHRAMNLGFNADRTANVLWRLRHGEVDGLSPTNVVLLIGTNKLSAGFLAPHGETPADVTAGILAIVSELHSRMPGARILVLSILPTTFSADRTARADAVNARVQAAVAALPFARWLDVTGIFLDRRREGSRVRQELFYDPLLYPGSAALHPTAAGQRMMAEAVARALYAD
jgi:lysophospholipase L1-like esterase